MKIHNRQGNKQVFFSLELVNILHYVEAEPVKKRVFSSLFSGHSDINTTEAPVAEKVDSAIHRINLYPVDSAIGFPNTYSPDRDVSDG